MVCERFIGLVRVSTDRQGESGLGLKAGHDDLRRYVEARGATLITTLEEVESGTHDSLIDRPTLLKALTLCKRHRACLLIPKVDRLVRSVVVHADIKRSGVPFRAVDNPEANEFTLDILVAVAAHEGRQISERTKKALAAYKAHGMIPKWVRQAYPDGLPPEVEAEWASKRGKLGSHLTGSFLTEEDRAKGRAKANEARAKEAVEVYADLIDDMKAWRAEGHSLKQIAERLNSDGIPTRTGAEWTPTTVKRVLDRIK